MRQATYSDPLEGLGPAARWCLTAGVTAEPSEVPKITNFSNEVECILREGIAGVALRGIESNPDWRADPASVLIYRAAMDGQLRSLRVDTAGAKLLSAFNKSGVKFAVIKGPTMAELHPRGWSRSYSDVDIVVPPRYFRDALNVAFALEYEHSDRSIPQWPWFDTLCREGINLHGPSGGNVDIHHHLPPWALTSNLDTDNVINRSIPGYLSGVPVRIAHRNDQLIVASLHILNDLWKGKLGLNSWRDVVVLLNLIGANEASEAFEREDLGWLLETITTGLSSSVPEAEVPPIISKKKRSSVIDWRLRVLGWNNDSAISRHRLSWALRLPAVNGLAYAFGVAFPSKAYIQDRHGSRFAYWKEGWSETVHTLSGADYRMTTVEDKESTPNSRQ